MKTKINKKQVGKILTSLQKINPDEVSNEDGNMDFEKLKERKEIKEAIEKLKQMGVDRKYLLDNFFIAGMTIGHLLN